ncbi:hypothetical protein D3C71_18800 [compost metagenome]
MKLIASAMALGCGLLCAGAASAAEHLLPAGSVIAVDVPVEAPRTTSDVTVYFAVHESEEKAEQGPQILKGCAFVARNAYPDFQSDAPRWYARVEALSCPAMGQIFSVQDIAHLVGPDGRIGLSARVPRGGVGAIFLSKPLRLSATLGRPE